jgi:hypothetical protein
MIKSALFLLLSAVSLHATGIDLADYVDCRITRNRATVYTGGAADPWCVGYDPRLGVKHPERLLDAAIGAAPVDPLTLPMGGQFGAVVPANLILDITIWTNLQPMVTEPDAEYLTLLNFRPFSFSVPIRANLPGQGYAQLQGSVCDFCLGLDAGLGFRGGLRLDLVTPVFQLGQDDVVAIANISTDGIVMSDIVDYFGMRKAGTLLAYSANPSQSDSPVPEPGTGTAVAIALAIIGRSSRRRFRGGSRLSVYNRIFARRGAERHRVV